MKIAHGKPKKKFPYEPLRLTDKWNRYNAPLNDIDMKKHNLPVVTAGPVYLGNVPIPERRTVLEQALYCLATSDGKPHVKFNLNVPQHKKHKVKKHRR